MRPHVSAPPVVRWRFYLIASFKNFHKILPVAAEVLVLLHDDNISNDSLPTERDSFARGSFFESFLGLSKIQHLTVLILAANAVSN